jgi:hypothetical protein
MELGLGITDEQCQGNHRIQVLPPLNDLPIALVIPIGIRPRIYNMGLWRNLWYYAVGLLNPRLVDSSLHNDHHLVPDYKL